MTAITLGLFVSLILICIWIGWHTRKANTSIQQFALAGKSLSTAVLVATTVATLVGGGVILGTIEKSYESGLMPAFALLGFAVQFCLMALFVAPKLNNIPRSLSIGELFATDYGKRGRIFVGVCATLFSTATVILQVSALSHILYLFVPNIALSTLICGLSVMVYCYFGGVRAVILTDVIQIFMICGAIPLIMWGTLYQAGGLNNVITQTPFYFWSLTGSHSGFLPLGSAFFGFLIGEALTPPLVQRLMISYNPAIARKALLWGSLLIIPLFVSASLTGCAIYSMNASLSTIQIIPFLLQEAMPEWLVPVAMLGLAAVIMSSTDSYLNAATVSLVHDVLHPLGAIHNDSELTIARVSTLIIGSIAIFSSLFVTSLFGLQLAIYKLWGPIIVIPLIGIFYRKTISERQFLTMSGIVVLTILFWNLFQIEPLTGINDIIPATIISLSLHAFMRKRYATKTRLI